MDHEGQGLLTRLATSERDLRGAERLRYRVFVEELGADSPLTDHDGRFERDRFDPYCAHLVLVDKGRSEAALDHVVGVYRLMTAEGATRAGQFYSEDEYDLTPLKQSGRRLLELGRSCLHPDFRGGTAMHRLWGALAAFVRETRVEILFGVASFHGTEIDRIAQSLSLLHHEHLAAPELRVRARDGVYQPMDLVPASEIDRVAAMREVPALIKAYLRLGGVVGDGAFVDHPFNTTDVCLILDTGSMNARAAAMYERGAR